MAVAGRIAQKRGQAVPEQFRRQLCLSFQQGQGQSQLVEGIAAAFVGPHRLPGAADEVVGVQIGHGRMTIKEAHQARQQPRLLQESAGLRRRAAQGNLAATARIRHRAVEIEPVRGEALLFGCGIDLATASQEVLGIDARSGIDFDHGRIRRHGGPLDRSIHWRRIACQDQAGQMAGPGSPRHGPQHVQEHRHLVEHRQLDARRRLPV